MAIDLKAYKDIDDDLSRDNVIGDHDFVVDEVRVPKTWDDGRVSYNYAGHLEDTGTKLFLDLGDPIAPEVIKAESSRGKQFAMMAYVKKVAALETIGLKYDALEVGDRFRVSVKRKKPDAGYTQGLAFIDRIVGKAKGGADDVPGF